MAIEGDVEALDPIDISDVVFGEAEHAEHPARRRQRLPQQLQVHRRELQLAPAPDLLLLVLVDVASVL